MKNLIVFEKIASFKGLLKVKNNYNVESDWLTKTVTIMNKGPNAIAGDDLISSQSIQVQFNGMGTDDDGKITLFEWDFDGNGIYDWTSGENGITTFLYKNIGTYNATLKVTDDDGAVDFDFSVITVENPNDLSVPHFYENENQLNIDVEKDNFSESENQNNNDIEDYYYNETENQIDNEIEDDKYIETENQIDNEIEDDIYDENENQIDNEIEDDNYNETENQISNENQNDEKTGNQISYLRKDYDAFTLILLISIIIMIVLACAIVVRKNKIEKNK